MKAVHSLITLVAAVLLIACGSKQPPTLFEGTTAQDAVNQITAKLSRPIRVLQIEITPNSLSMQIQDSTALNHVDEYRYNQAGILHRDSVSGPRPVQLSLINPKLEENLYNIEEVSLIAVPDTIREALKRIALEGGGMVERIEIKRRVSIIPVPQNGDVRWTISVRSPRETATAYSGLSGQSAPVYTKTSASATP